jgi:magnesium transporter
MSKKWHRRKKRSGSYNASSSDNLQADPNLPAPEISVIVYDKETIVERVAKQPSDLRDLLGAKSNVWINVTGLGDPRVVVEICELFGLHKLAVEDVINSRQRAKYEEYDSFIFFVARMLLDGERLDTEQLSMFFTQSWAVTFQEFPGSDPFDPIRERLRKGHGHLRGVGTDYLAYCLLDSVIDAYYPALEVFGERLDDLEAQISLRLEPGMVTTLHEIKRDLLTLRRAIWPLRDAINSMLREDSPIVAADTKVFLRDCYDHVVAIIDLIETYRELGSSLTDVYLSSVSNRMNEVMKVLTIISTIFLPASLIAGIYGMNFNYNKSPLNMPELNWYYGYPFALLLMIVLTVITLSLFKNKGWLGGDSSKPTTDRQQSTS